MTNQSQSITVAITRTFTPTDDPFGLFSLRDAMGDLSVAIAEMRWETLYVASDERQLAAVDALLEDAQWVLSEGGASE